MPSSLLLTRGGGAAFAALQVIADDTPAVQAVLKADKKRATLLEEEKTLLAHLEAADAAEVSLQRRLALRTWC